MFGNNLSICLILDVTGVRYCICLSQLPLRLAMTPDVPSQQRAFAAFARPGRAVGWSWSVSPSGVHLALFWIILFGQGFVIS